MLYCPNCKAEYKEGVDICKECIGALFFICGMVFSYKFITKRISSDL